MSMSSGTPDANAAEADMFGSPAERAHADPSSAAPPATAALPTLAEEDLANAIRTSKVVFTGELTKIEVRFKPVDEAGHHGPVLCLEIEVDSPVPHTVRAERPHQFRHEAEQEAASLKKGQRISVSSPLLGVRIYLPAVEIVPPQQTEPSAS